MYSEINFCFRMLPKTAGNGPMKDCVSLFCLTYETHTVDCSIINTELFFIGRSSEIIKIKIFQPYMSLKTIKNL